jgi:hypothetical protein
LSLGALSVLHVLWACGSPWPASDRKTLAQAVGGFSEFPGPAACLLVAALLGVSAAAVAGTSNRSARFSQFASSTTAVVLTLRGAVGLAGFMPNGKRSLRFATLDRRVYSPLCLALAAMALAAASEQ